MLNQKDSHNLALIADEISRIALAVDELLRLLRKAGLDAVNIAMRNKDTAS